jgi:hypothetical protein
MKLCAAGCGAALISKQLRQNADYSASCFPRLHNLKLSRTTLGGSNPNTTGSAIRHGGKDRDCATYTDVDMAIEKIGAWVLRRWTPIYEAVREVSIIALITLTPVWAGVLLSLLLKELPSFQLALRANTERGDLYLLATAMLAPLALYISLRRGNLPRPFTIHFPGGWAFILLLALLFGVSVFLFAVKRIADLPSTALKIDLACTRFG